MLLHHGDAIRNSWCAAEIFEANDDNKGFFHSLKRRMGQSDSTNSKIIIKRTVSKDWLVLEVDGNVKK